jgi:hypothetical protein
MKKKKRAYICSIIKQTKTNNMNNYQSQKIEETFISMVKIEMLLSGKSFNECKVTVKEYLKSNNLM